MMNDESALLSASMFQNPAYPVDAVRQAVASLAERNVFIGTSSWKYPGWSGLLYEEQRYLYRGKFATSRFQRDCLEEYARVFRSVCVDAGYYKFPSPQYIAGLCEQVPDGFRFTFKVTDQITARTFVKLDHHGNKAGQRNPHFLDAELFRAAFLSSLAPHREKIGLLIFEFSHFHPRDFERGREFVEMLDAFLAQLPQGWQYGVEVRNASLLVPEYFAMLKRHGVAHVMNQWTHMPVIAEQWQMPGVLSAGDFTAARFLLKPGRTYEQAVKMFAPYNATKEPYPEARDAAARIILHLLDVMRTQPTRHSFIYFNNRLEGNALMTILAVLNLCGLLPQKNDISIPAA
jgi:uncharacterized protein YecE (DUF72 family)